MQIGSFPQASDCVRLTGGSSGAFSDRASVENSLRCRRVSGVPSRDPWPWWQGLDVHIERISTLTAWWVYLLCVYYNIYIYIYSSNPSKATEELLGRVDDFSWETTWNLSLRACLLLSKACHIGVMVTNGNSEPADKKRQKARDVSGNFLRSNVLLCGMAETALETWTDWTVRLKSLISQTETDSLSRLDCLKTIQNQGYKFDMLIWWTD